MLMPSILGEKIFDGFMDDFGFPTYHGQANTHASGYMRADVKETDNGYELDIDIPGYKKEDVKAKLKDGYLTISAETNNENDTKDEDGKYIRRERYYGSMSRTFYVGDGIKDEDIKAKYADGTLSLFVPKPQPVVPEEKYIAIEG